MFRIASLALVAASLIVTAERSSAQIIVTPAPYAYGPLGYANAPGPFFYGPTVGPWFGPNYGPGFSNFGYVGVWGGTWAALPWYPGYGWYGMNFYTFPAPTLGPTPGAFSATGGYGIGGGVYGAQRDLPTIIPKGNGPRFATRDVREHFDNVKANPQAAIERARQNQNWWRFR